MKKSIPILLIMALAGCASSQFTYRRTAEIVFVKEGDVRQFKNEAGRPGNAVGGLNYKKGDTIQVFAYYLGGNTGGRIKSGYLTVQSNDSVWVAEEDVITECAHDAEMQPADFFVPDSLDKKMWARANYYVSSNADMKIQTANEYLIDTYNATSVGLAAYTISKEPLDKGFTYHVKCRLSKHKIRTGIVASSKAQMYAQMCAYYIVTGKCK